EQQPQRLRALHMAGRLKDLPGVGETIAAIIGEVLDGRVPAYLAELEAARLPARSAAADAYRRALRGDCHSHSDWSDGGSDIRTMAEAAIALGHTYLVLTDHSPRLTRPRPRRGSALRPTEGRGPPQRGTGAVPDPHRHRSGHPGGRLPRPGRGAAGRSGRGGGQRALQAADGGAGHDGPDAGGYREPALRHPRALYRANHCGARPQT